MGPDSEIPAANFISAFGARGEIRQTSAHFREYQMKPPDTDGPAEKIIKVIRSNIRAT
jgi:hypothetical protein